MWRNIWGKLKLPKRDAKRDEYNCIASAKHKGISSGRWNPKSPNKTNSQIKLHVNKGII